jgi:hypothetical protein
MLPYEELIVGIATGLTLFALLRYTPLWRDFLAATAATGLLDFLVSDQSRHKLDLPSLAEKLPSEIVGHPHFYLGVAFAAASVLAMLHALRTR